MGIQIKRVYDELSASDGTRVLVDRLWPRGVSKEEARLDAWLKQIAPSPELRRWWNHDRSLLDEFAVRYRAELDTATETTAAVQELRTLIARDEEKQTTTTLLYGARDPMVNHARILAEYVIDRA